MVLASAADAGQAHWSCPHCSVDFVGSRQSCTTGSVRLSIWNTPQHSCTVRYCSSTLLPSVSMLATHQPTNKCIDCTAMIACRQQPRMDPFSSILPAAAVNMKNVLFPPGMIEVAVWIYCWFRRAQRVPVCYARAVKAFAMQPRFYSLKGSFSLLLRAQSEVL